MALQFSFFFNSISLGVGLAMDAFSVSLANGLNEPKMKAGRVCGVAGIFGIFQGLMPLLGWVFVHTVLQYFTALKGLIPWIALVLLAFIGGKMLLEGLRHKDSGEEAPALTFSALLLQGVATSIDALSVGFTIAEYDLFSAALSACIIAAVTFVICVAGLHIGKAAGTKLAGKAEILGGAILILIGIEIFVTGLMK